MRSDRQPDHAPRRRSVRRASRRSLVAAGALVTVLGLTSCATFENQRVASVNDHELTQDELRIMLDSELGQTLLQTAPIEGQVVGSSVRSIVSAWIALQAFSDADLLSAEQLEGARQAAIVEYGDQFTNAPAIMQELATLNAAAGAAIGNGDILQEDALSAVRDADVSVDSFYGAWDDESLSVVEMG